MSSGKFYGSDSFNPRLITTQIVVMQSSFWFCLGATTAIVDLFIGEKQSAEQLFDPEAYTWNTRRGLALSMSLWITALVMAVLLRFVVERAKKCLDFVATYHIFHLLATYFASGFPSYFHWWAIQAPALIGAVVIGEYFCMLAETEAIQLSKKPPPTKKPKQPVPSFDEI
eukprot:TRINITY_DN11337_c2_g1_i1.p1 TRINITY_DN11337_c2_g1~~TRINITY_DN11337_c2_g1_i1.p1  ORF type:complete len:170 (+),score=26.71 TRINITY_DN11337_c2_g1_i1:88-597(+)